MRQRKKSRSGKLIALSALGIALLLAALYFSGAKIGSLKNPGGEKFGTFSAAGFLDNPKTHAGNHYRIEGTLDNILDSSTAGGGVVRLVSLSVEGGRFVPLLVPEGSSAFALQRGQSVVALCEVSIEGLPVARSIEKK